MPRFSNRRRVLHRADQMFDLVADVERYPEFVPLCHQLSVRQRTQQPDGTEVVVRAISPEDEPLIVQLHAGHSEHTIRMRFFSLVKILSHDALIRLCHLDYDREMALVAVRQEADGPHLLGVSRYYLRLETGAAEFALVVGDAHRPIHVLVFFLSHGLAPPFACCSATP